MSCDRVDENFVERATGFSEPGPPSIDLKHTVSSHDLRKGDLLELETGLVLHREESVRRVMEDYTR